MSDDPTPTPTPGPGPGDVDESDRASRWRIAAITLGVLALIVVVVLIVVLLTGDDDEPATSSTSTVPTSTPTSVVESTTIAPTTTIASTTSTSTTTTVLATTTTSTSTTTTVPASTSTSSAPPTIPPPDGDLDSAVWPDASGPVGYTNPEVLVSDFVTERVGMSDPDVGQLLQGDARSGEIAVRAAPDSALVTTVFVRQLGPNDLWWVIGAATENIVVDEPTALDTVDSPLTVSGSGVAFEGTIAVTLWADGAAEPLGETFVTASGGPELGPFTGTLTFPVPDVTGGSLLFTSNSAEDGSVLEFGAIRVLFP